MNVINGLPSKSFGANNKVWRGIVLSMIFMFVFAPVGWCAGQLAELKQNVLNPLVEKDVPYGNRTNEIGRMGGLMEKISQGPIEDIPPCGPESFCCDVTGNLFVADTVNSRIQFYSNTGAYLRTLDLGSQVLCSDIVVDEQGNIFVFDDKEKRLVSYDKSGKEQSSLSVPRELWESRGPMHLVKNHIYIAADDQRDIAIAACNGGKLTAVASTTSDEVNKGIYGSDGRRYSIELIRYKQIHVEVEAGQNVSCIVDLPLEGVVSATFLGVTTSGNFFVQTERMEGDAIKLAVHQFRSDGQILATSELSENDYGFWSVKLLCIDANGTIWQAIPSSKFLKIRAFLQETS